MRWLAVLLVLALPVAAQTPIETSPLKDHEHYVVVSGCLKGKRLDQPVLTSTIPPLPSDLMTNATFSIEGPKDLMKEIERHKNHRDQIIGIATVPPSMFIATSQGPTRRIGPISIGIGGNGRMDPMAGAERPRLNIKLKATSIVHVNDTCPK